MKRAKIARNNVEIEEAEILTLTHLDFQDFQVRLKIKLNNKYYTGILELSE